MKLTNYRDKLSKYNYFFIMSFFISTHLLGAISYNLSANSTVVIDEFGVCKTLTNTVALNYIVPTGISNDWSSFLAHLPAGVNSSQCCTSPQFWNGTACVSPVNCVGYWSYCTGGIQVYTITTPATSGGAACVSANGATQACCSDDVVGYEHRLRNETPDYVFEYHASPALCGIADCACGSLHLQKCKRSESNLATVYKNSCTGVLTDVFYSTWYNKFTSCICAPSSIYP